MLPPSPFPFLLLLDWALALASAWVEASWSPSPYCLRREVSFPFFLLYFTSSLILWRNSSSHRRSTSAKAPNRGGRLQRNLLGQDERTRVAGGLVGKGNADGRFARTRSTFPREGHFQDPRVANRLVDQPGSFCKVRCKVVSAAALLRE